MDGREELVALFAQLCKDETPMVRRVAAVNLGAFVGVVSEGHPFRCSWKTTGRVLRSCLSRE